MLYECIVIYCIIVLIYFRFCNIENSKWEKFIFSIFVPVIGFINVIMSEHIKIKASEEVAEEKKNTEKEKNKEYLTKIQSSLVDNLTIKDYEKARETILSSKALPLEEQCKICHIAIKSKNFEISHISAVSLMRIQNYFEKFLVHMGFKTDLSKIENLKKYIDGIYKYLDCKLVQGALENKYRKKLIQLIKELISREKDCGQKYYMILIKIYILEEENGQAMQFIEDYVDIYGINEEIYLLILEICIKTKNISNFHDTLKIIKSEPVMAKKLEPILEFWEG